MTTPISIPASTFALAFKRFELAVKQFKGSPGPFESFQSGLAYEWEHYKEWLFLEARRVLCVEEWNKSWIGSGKILARVISAIEIHHDKRHRNNIVEWQGRYGPEGKSHRRLLEARRGAAQKRDAEEVLYDMYFSKAQPQKCFDRLIELFGARYDLISYLFFIRDWSVFMPVKASFFSNAFALLGVPLQMTRRCTWENYTSALARLREVQKHLEGYEIPGGVRLIDAHSFCWMLVGLPAPRTKKVASQDVVSFAPVAGKAPRGVAVSDGMSQSELDEVLKSQKRIGDLAQMIVLKAERVRLTALGRRDLAVKVRDVSDDIALGYDIESFDRRGESKQIEVKAAARRGKDLRFFLSENERRQSVKMKNFTFALVLDVQSEKPSIYEFKSVDLPPNSLHPAAYEVRLQSPELVL